MALGSIAGSPPPSQTAALNSTTNFDNSGFVVNIGGGTATSTNAKTEMPTVRETARAVAAGAGSLLANPAFLVLIGVGLYLYLKHK
ncbi:hypothetical protein [Massilia sp. DD77]|uniref:hypothetical protein n=1 Tax=Massilia sp. DD77 TaxID=3109349 RepID=UPI003000F7D5